MKQYDLNVRSTERLSYNISIEKLTWPWQGFSFPTSVLNKFTCESFMVLEILLNLSNNYEFNTLISNI